MSGTTDLALEVLDDPDGVARRVADWLVGMALTREGRFTIALSGGSTPRLLYERLAQAPYSGNFPWDRTHLFWGDERFVPHDDARSNYRMVRDALLSRVPIPPANIHPMTTEGKTPAQAAALYEKELLAFYGSPQLDPDKPLFDVVLLGLGPDGHTASLFPGRPVLEERERWVAAVAGPDAEMRLTLTYPVLESSRQVAFLVTGAEKKAILARLRSRAPELPAARVKPVGTLTCFADKAAAGK